MTRYSGSGSLTIELDLFNNRVVEADNRYELNIPIELLPNFEEVTYELEIQFSVYGTRISGGRWEPDEIEERYEFCGAFINGEELDNKLGESLFNQLEYRLHEGEISID